MTETTDKKNAEATEKQTQRRDFLALLSLSTAAVGTASLLWPVIDSMNPSADVLALSSTEVDLSLIEKGQRVTVVWRGKPVFVVNRTQQEINLAKESDASPMVDPQKDEDRVKKGNEQWLVIVGVCTHLGCIPLGQKDANLRGKFGGWYCPCHGSAYDTSGRIRKGPAPRNLDVPDYKFVSKTVIKIG